MERQLGYEQRSAVSYAHELHRRQPLAHDSFKLLCLLANGACRLPAAAVSHDRTVRIVAVDGGLWQLEVGKFNVDIFGFGCPRGPRSSIMATSMVF